MAITISAPQSSAALMADVASSAAFSASTVKIAHTPAKQLVAGTSATQVAKIHSAQYLVTSGTPLSIDLTSAVDPATGAAQNFGFVSRYLVSNEGTVTGNNMTVGGGTNGLHAADPRIYGIGGHCKFDAGDQEIVVDGTHKLLVVTLAAGTAVPINVTVFGR